MPAPAQWPPTVNPRAGQVSTAVQDALSRYAAVLDTDAPFRSVTIEVKMRDDGKGVRAVLVSFQGEAESKNRS